MPFTIDISGLNTTTAKIEYITEGTNYNIGSTSYNIDVSVNYKLFDNIFYVKTQNTITTDDSYTSSSSSEQYLYLKQFDFTIKEDDNGKFDLLDYTFTTGLNLNQYAENYYTGDASYTTPPENGFFLTIDPISYTDINRGATLIISVDADSSLMSSLMTDASLIVHEVGNNAIWENSYFTNDSTFKSYAYNFEYEITINDVDMSLNNIISKINNYNENLIEISVADQLFINNTTYGQIVNPTDFTTILVHHLAIPESKSDFMARSFTTSDVGTLYKKINNIIDYTYYVTLTTDNSFNISLDEHDSGTSVNPVLTFIKGKIYRFTFPNYSYLRGPDSTSLRFYIQGTENLTTNNSYLKAFPSITGVNVYGPQQYNLVEFDDADFPIIVANIFVSYYDIIIKLINIDHISDKMYYTFNNNFISDPLSAAEIGNGNICIIQDPTPITIVTYKYSTSYQHWPDISFSEGIISNSTKTDVDNFTFNNGLPIPLKYFGPSWIAKNITGGYNNSDLFSNETELVNQYVELDSKGTIISPIGIKQKLQKKLSNAGSFDYPLDDSNTSSSNLSKVVFDTLLRSVKDSNNLKPQDTDGVSSESAERMVDKIAETGNNEWINIEFSPNDTIQFKLIYSSSSITNESNIAVDNNGNQLGTNIVENQNYLVRINLIEDITVTIPPNDEIKQIIPTDFTINNNNDIDIDLSNIILHMSESTDTFPDTDFTSISNAHVDPFASSSLSLANFSGISHIDGTNDYTKNAGTGYKEPTATRYPGWHHFQNIVDNTHGFQNCWISNQGGELAYCGLRFDNAKFISGFSIGGLGSSYIGSKNRYNGYHQFQVAFCRTVDHTTSSDNWFNIGDSFNRTNHGTFFYKFIEKDTLEDTFIFCTGIRLLVQPYINSDNTFDALAIDEFKVYTRKENLHITPIMITRFMDKTTTVVSSTTAPYITTYYVDSDATSNDISNNIDISRNYILDPSPYP